MSNKKKTFYITTPIYYPSGNLHIGHLYSTTIAWVLRNYKIKMGYDVKFLTGSDEHGQKIEKKAQEKKISPQEYVDIQSNKFIDLWKKTKINYNFFSRTTNKYHEKIVEEIFNKMLDKSLIYKGEYKGLYSINDEEFILEKEAIKKDDNFYHPISGHKLEWIQEESYFFKMNKFTHWLIDYVEKTKNFIIPKNIWKELKNNFLDKNLEDLSVTRISFEWGIQITKDPKHVIYVWLDALFNYISALGFDFENPQKDFIKYWKNGDEIVHIVGKEITRFHCIYWPIFLKSLDIRLPTTILSHGWLITPEGKMSKSKGNVIDPLSLLNKYDPEIIKYFFSSKISIYKDGIFSEELLINSYNSDLANTIGNLISRTISMIRQNFCSPVKFKKTNNNHDLDIIKSISNNFEKFKKHFDKFEIDLAFESMLHLARDLNKYIDLTMPWKMKNNLDLLETTLNLLLNGSYAVLSMLEVVCPDFVNQFKQILNVDNFDFDEIENFEKFNDISINENKIIFPRIK